MATIDEPLHLDALEVVRSYCDVWLAGDHTSILEFYGADLTLTWPGRHRLAGTHDGLDASLSALLELQILTNRAPIDVVDVTEHNDEIVAVVIERWSRPADPATVDVRRTLHFTVDGGRLRSCRIVESDQEVVDAWIGADD